MSETTGTGNLDKAPDAFRTISEVADDLDIPQHVLRFWETRFTQIKPMKRSGGRPYHPPARPGGGGARSPQKKADEAGRGPPLLSPGRYRSAQGHSPAFVW